MSGDEGSANESCSGGMLASSAVSPSTVETPFIVFERLEFGNGKTNCFRHVLDLR